MTVAEDACGTYDVRDVTIINYLGYPSCTIGDLGYPSYTIGDLGCPSYTKDKLGYP